MAKYIFLDLAEDVLQASGVALAPLEIWKRAVESGFSEKLKTQGKTPWVTLASRLYVDTKDNPSTRFVRLGETPVLFGLKSAGHQLKKVEDISENEDGFRGSSKGVKERDLHPFLAYFSFSIWIEFMLKPFTMKNLRKRVLASGCTRIWWVFGFR